MQGFSTFTSTPYYHTVEDLPGRVDELALERVSRYAAEALRRLQDVPPEALRLREVPNVSVSAPASARPGAAVPVEIRVTTPLGAPLAGTGVRVLVNQHDHWAAAEGAAREVGPGVYRYTVPAGATEASRTSITATVNRPEWMAEGYASVDQRAGGLLPANRRRCTSRRVIRIHLRSPRRLGRIVRLRARVSAARARVRVVRRKRVVVLDLRRVGRRTVRLRLTARTAAGGGSGTSGPTARACRVARSRGRSAAELHPAT